MNRFARAITHHAVLIIVIFLVAAAACALLIPTVGVNYNMADYLPPSAQSTKAVELMEREFSGGLPNASVMARDVDIAEALAIKEQLSDVDGVTDVMWLDDAINVKEPLEMADQATVEGFYKDGCALYTVTIDEAMERSAVEEIEAMLGDRVVVAGSAADNTGMMAATSIEVGNAVAILVPVILVILILSSSTWMNPLLYILSIGTAIVLNMGTNVVFGQVSFITNSVSPILQLAVSLDYSVFLLNSFARNRERFDTPERAMEEAIKESASTVASSMLTTLAGFLALAFMNFRIGADLGINLAKGIVLSFICTIVFLPAATLKLHRLMDRTRHRPFLPSFAGVYRFFSKTAVPVVAAVAILVVPCFLGQARTRFVYGSSAVANNISSEQAQGSREIEAVFGSSTPVALLVPRGDVAREYELGQDLLGLDHVTSVVSYASAVGTAFPAQFVGEDVTSQFYSPDWARIVVYTDTESEGDEAFETVEAITAVAREYYGDDVFSAGESSNLYDMKTLVTQDNIVVTLVAAAAILVILLFTFRSATLPFILLFTIEAAIWMNLAIPYFTGTTINFIGYLVLNTVQLGATVDYAILLTTTYLRERRLGPQKEAMGRAMGEAFGSILVSASVLTVAGFVLAGTSSNPPVQDIGTLLGRGTILSFVMVMCFLPAMLRFFDKAVGRTTYHADFYQGPEERATGRVGLDKKEASASEG